MEGKMISANNRERDGNKRVYPTIVKQMCAQGSYGLRKINQQNGKDIGHVINVWHVYYRDTRQASFLTRGKARAFAATIDNASIRG
jgi:hypothetical protein